MNVITRSFQMAFEPLWNKHSRVTTAPGAHGRVSKFEQLINKINHRRRVNRAIRELDDLNDDVLKDIGIVRGNIPELVDQMMASHTEPEPGQKSESSVSTRTAYPVVDGVAT